MQTEEDMRPYRIVSGDSASVLERNVAKRLDQGYSLAGGVFVHERNGWYMQAVVLPPGWGEV